MLDGRPEQTEVGNCLFHVDVVDMVDMVHSSLVLIVSCLSVSPADFMLFSLVIVTQQC